MVVFLTFGEASCVSGTGRVVDGGLIALQTLGSHGVRVPARGGPAMALWPLSAAPSGWWPPMSVRARGLWG
jgi:hypothetical protein